MKTKSVCVLITLLFNYSHLFSTETELWQYQDSLKSGEQLIYIDAEHVYAYDKPRIYEPFARFGGDLLKLTDRSFA